MGMEDRDWYREEAKQRFRNALNAKVDPDWRLRTNLPPITAKGNEKNTFATKVIIICLVSVAVGYIAMAAADGKGEGFKYLNNISHNIRLRLIQFLSD